MPRSRLIDLSDVGERDLSWLAGLLEGEGAFLAGPPSSPRQPAIAVEMTDEEVIRRVSALMGVSLMPVKPREAHWKPSYAVRIRGARAMAWMTALYPLLGSRRQAQIDRARACYAPKDSAILTEQKAAEALTMLDQGQSVRSVAHRFDVSVWCIYDLRLGRTHRHVPRPQGFRATRR